MKNELFFLAVQRIKGTKRNSFLLGIILLCSFAFTVITLGITDSLMKQMHNIGWIPMVRGKQQFIMVLRRKKKF